MAIEIPGANGNQKTNGWTVNVKYLEEIADLAEKMEPVSLEQVEAVLCGLLDYHGEQIKGV